jgi:hypothetical protein
MLRRDPTLIVAHRGVLLRVLHIPRVKGACEMTPFGVRCSGGIQL